MDTHICCIAPSKSVCSSPPPWHVSCSRLIADTVLLLLYIILSCLIFCLNAASIVVQTCFSQSSSAYAHTVRAINLTDMFLSVYLVIIWIANLYFGETFFLAEKVWKSSMMCFIASFIILYFMFSIQYLLLFLSCARLMVVIKPMNTKFKRKSFTLKCIVGLCVMSFLGSVGFCMIFAFVQKHLPTDLCLPFVDPLGAHVTVVLTYFVTTSQFLVAAIIFVFHSLLAYHVQQSGKKVVATTQHTNLDPSMSLQLVLITLTNVMCWYPTNIVFLLAMAWNQYPVEMVVWTTIAATPINSLLNPGIFITFCVRSHLKNQPKAVRKLWYNQQLFWSLKESWVCEYIREYSEGNLRETKAVTVWPVLVQMSTSFLVIKLVSPTLKLLKTFLDSEKWKVSSQALSSVGEVFLCPLGPRPGSHHSDGEWFRIFFCQATNIEGNCFFDDPAVQKFGVTLLGVCEWE